MRPERIILIHGAWAGAWVWDGLALELGQLGWDCVALDLPGDGHHPIPVEDAREEDFHACIAEAIEGASGPVVLVGHSGGGMLVTAGADAFPDKVSHGIWVAGFLLPDGRSFDDIQTQIVGEGPRFGATRHIVSSSSGQSTSVPPEAAINLFFHDVPADVAKTAADRLTPQPVSGARLRTRVGPSFDKVQKLYFLAQQDRSVIPDAQRLMCEGVDNLDVCALQTGHVPQLTRAREMAEKIDLWLNKDPKE